MKPYSFSFLTCAVSFFVICVCCKKDDKIPNTTDSDIVWEYDIDKNFTSQPVCTSDKVIVETDDGSIHALNCLTGELSWSFEDNSFTKTDIQLVNSLRKPLIKNNIVYWGNAFGSVYAIDINSGHQIWHFQAWTNLEEANFPNESFKSGPYLHNDVLYILGQNRKLLAINSVDGQLLWENNQFINLHPSITFTDEYAILLEHSVHFPNQMKGINLKNGQTTWNVETYKQMGSNSIVINNIAYFETEGSLTPVNLSTLEILELINFPSANSRSIQLSSDLSILSDNNTIYGFNINNTYTKWSTQIKSEVFLQPCFENENIYLADEHNLYVLSKSTGNVIRKIEIADYTSNNNLVPIESPISSPTLNQEFIFVTHKDKLIAITR